MSVVLFNFKDRGGSSVKTGSSVTTTGGTLIDGKLWGHCWYVAI